MPTLSRDDPKAPQQERWSGDELIPFGKYILLNKISSGSTAAVYRAKIRGEAGFERLVTVKRILPHMAGDPEFVNTFVREAKTAARLNHTNICPIYELGKVGESLYMAMEWIAGKDLGAITRRIHKLGEVMPPVLAAWIAAKLCDALDYAHSLKDARGKPTGIIHRDLSPTNIMVSYEGQVKLIDFGLAKAAGRAQQTNVDALKQKLGYMSPELVKGRAPDSRSDIFGVGVCLYEMVTGRRLFAGKDDMATLKMVSNASVPPPSALVEDAPEDLELIIMRALEREPEDRWQHASEMAQALAGFIAKTDPKFGTQKASEWMHSHFEKEMDAEQKRVNALLEASHDAALLEERRRFFASPAGAAAMAKAEVARRMSTQPPRVLSDSGRPIISSDDVARNIPKTPALPRVAVEAGVRAPGPAAKKMRPGEATFEDEPTSFLQAGKHAPPAPGQPAAKDVTFDDEPTSFLQAGELEAAVKPSGDSFDTDEATAFFDGANHAKAAEAALAGAPAAAGAGAAKPKPPVPKPAGKAPPLPAPPSAAGKATPPTAPSDDLGYNAENTEFLGGDLLSSMVVDDKKQPAKPAADGGGGGGAGRGGSGGFGDEEATHIFFNKEDGVGVTELLEEIENENVGRVSVSQVRPVVAGGPPAPFSPRMSAPIISPQLMASPEVTQPARPAPAAPHTKVMPPAARVAATAQPSASRPRTKTMQIRVKRGPDRLSTVLLVLGVTMLALAVVGLLIKTPLGEKLGLRSADVGAIEVRSTPVSNATVKLDDVIRGHAPLRMDGVRTGLHRLELDAPGYARVVREVELSAGSTAMVDIALVPLTAAAPTPATP